MTFRSAFQSALIGTALFALPGNAAAQEYSLPDTLVKISNELYVRHNSYFILVDALRDGLIKDGQDVKLWYENGKVTFNDIALEEPYQSRYSKRLSDFANNGFYVGDRHSRGITTTISLRDILTATSTVRNMLDLNLTQGRKPTAIREALVEDLLVEPYKTARLLITKSAITIDDGAPLAADADKKYREMIAAYTGFNAEKDSDALLLMVEKKP